jgi:catechol 2,3-dioxygenase-like lactoylglutathione lyase family enzyme
MARERASLAAAALELARDGWEIFPCGLDKAPRTANGFKDASSDEAVVSAWNWDDATIGAAIPDGWLIVDVDPRNGGDETMAALRAAGHRLPKTHVVQSGGGGTHYYFEVPEGLDLRGKLGTGVDIKRAGRGYVIVPPTPGYKVLTAQDPAPVPEWLLDVIRVPEHDGTSGEAHAPKFLPFQAGTSYGLAALRGVLDELKESGAGGRNDALNRGAFAVAQLVAGGELDGEQAEATLEAAALDVGLTARETEKTLRSGWDAGLAEPRQAPPRGTTNEGVETKVLETFSAPIDESRFWLNWDVDEPEPPFLLHPILPENAYVLVYGSTEASKSMTFVLLAAEASRRGIRTTVYSLENPPHLDRDRLRRMGPDPAYFRQTNEPLDLNDGRQFQALVDREREWGTRLIIIDTYSHAFASRSEDGNARAIEFARRVRFLMHETGATVVVIDHTGYAQEDEPRDASAKRQQVDVAILMKKEGEWRLGADARFRMENKKAARFANPFTLNGAIKDGKDRALELAWTGKAPKWHA